MGDGVGSVACTDFPLISCAFRALLHSLALCPCPLQYRQRFCTIHRSHSVCINLPCTVRCQVTGDVLGAGDDSGVVVRALDGGFL